MIYNDQKSLIAIEIRKLMGMSFFVMAKGVTRRECTVMKPRCGVQEGTRGGMRLSCRDLTLGQDRGVACGP